MTRPDDTKLVDWMASGPRRAPAETLDAALARARTQRQRPAWLVTLSGGAIAGSPGAALLRQAILALAALLVTGLLVGAMVAGAMVAGAMLGSNPDASFPALDATATAVPSPESSGAPSRGLVAYTVTSCNPTTDWRRVDCAPAQVWIAAGDGSGARPLLADDGQGTDLAGWSADGSSLLAAHGNDLLLIDAAGADLGTFPVFYSCKDTECPDAQDYLCAFPCTGVDGFELSPDGSRVAFVRSYANADEATVIAILDLASGRVTELPSTRATQGSERCWESPACEGSDDTPRWSPDGSRIAFARQVMSPEPGSAWTSAALFVVGADGDNLHRVTPPGLYAFDPHWSPDGGRLAFTNTEFVVNADHTSVLAMKADIYTIGLDGAGLTRLTDDGISARSDWTTDGRLAFMRQAGADAASGHDAWVMDADGGNQARLGTSLAELTAAGCRTCFYPLVDAPPNPEARAFWQPRP